MAEKSDVVLEEDTVRIRSTGRSPIAAIEGGNNWDLSESDGDFRIGGDENMLKMGVATEGEGAGDARIWATRDLRLGGRGESVLKIDSEGILPTGKQYNLGTDEERWNNAYLGGQVRVESGARFGGNVRIGNDPQVFIHSTANRRGGIWSGTELLLGTVEDEVNSIVRIASPPAEESRHDGVVKPDYPEGSHALGTADNRWTANLEVANVETLSVNTVTGNLVTTREEKATTLAPGNLGAEDIPWNALYVDTVEAETVNANSVNSASDRRLKANIENLEGGLDTILDLRPISYEWRDNGDETHLGLVGQEVADVLPEVADVPEGDDGYFGVDYTELVAVLVDAVQEQHAEKEALEERVDRQQERIEDQEERIADLEERLAALEE